MHRLVLICSAGFLLAGMIPRMASGNPLTFVRDRVQDEVDETAVIEENEIDRDVVVAPPVVLTQTRQGTKGKNKYKLIKKEWVRLSKSPPNAVSAPLRSHIELECEAMGSPSPQIHWLRGTEPLRQLDELMGNSIAEIDTTPSTWGGITKTVSRLVIDCASPRDQGVIHCAAVAGGKTVLSQPIMLLINELSKANGSSCGAESRPRVTLNSPIVMSIIGSTVTLPCRASGRPRPPRTFWLDNEGRPITASSNIRHKVLGSGELVIEPLLWDDMGEFACIAQSERDEDVATTFLYPMASDDNDS